MRKIDAINQLRAMGLKVAEAREFKASELKEMLEWANHLLSKYGTFNLRTDTPNGDRAGINLPFIMNCSINQLMKLVQEKGDSITYIPHQHFDVKDQLFNGTLRLIKGHVVGEINDVDQTSQRAGLLNAVNLKQICDSGSNLLMRTIKTDLQNANQDAWFELTAYKDGSVVYWQIVSEPMNEHLKNLFFNNK